MRQITACDEERVYILTEIVCVRFNERGKVYFFDPAGLAVSKGENVVVETAKGNEYGECTRGNHVVDDSVVVQPLRPVVRIATEEDNKTAQSGKEKEKEAFDYCQKKIVEFGLDMKLVNVEYGFEGNKILFFFTSEGRVDFRDLVKDLAGMFRARIELRQIGVRDEAKMLGGLGVCGKAFCCSQFLTEFHPVSIKMAKTQGLSLNPTKISGACGRLMCCLKYEECAYEDLVKKAPKIDAFVETPSGKGSVVNINLLRRNAKVRLEDGYDTTLKTFTFDELDVLGGKGRRAEYIAARAEGKLEEAGFSVSPPPVIKHSFEPSRPLPREHRHSADGSASKRDSAHEHKSSHEHKASGEHKPQHEQRKSSNEHKASHEHKPQHEQRKSGGPQGADRHAKDGDKKTKQPRPQPAEGAPPKKPFNKRRRGGRGKK